MRVKKRRIVFYEKQNMKKSTFLLILLLLILFFTNTFVFSQNNDLLYKQADSLYEEALYNKSILIYNEIIDNNPKDAIAYNRRANCYSSIENVDQSMLDYLKAIELDSLYSSPYTNIGRTYLIAGKFNQAKEYLFKAHMIAPDSAYIYGIIGNYFIETNQTDSAIYYLNEGLKRDKDLYFGNYYLALAYISKEDSKNALLNINKSIEKHPKDYYLLATRAEVFLAQQEYEKSIDDCKKFREEEPENYLISETLAKVYYEQGDFEKAFIESKQIITNDTSNYIALYVLSEYFLMNANYEMSILYSKKGTVNYPETPYFYYSLGRVHHVQKNLEKANTNFEKAISLAGSSSFYTAYLQNKLLQVSEKELDENFKFFDISQENMKSLFKETKNKKSPFEYKTLKKKIKGDCSSLSLKEYFMLYLGRTQQKKFSGYTSVFSEAKIGEYFKNEEYQKCIDLSLGFLDQNPTSIKSYEIIFMSYLRRGDIENYKKYLTAYIGILESILATGDGLSEETAFIVSSVNDEYQILYYLGYQTAGQALLNKNGHTYDKLNIPSENDEKNGFYFNIDVFFGKLF